jgi:hypothetical protein
LIEINAPREGLCEKADCAQMSRAHGASAVTWRAWGLSLPRWIGLLAGVAFAGVALSGGLSGALSGAPDYGHCLTGAAPAEGWSIGHCGWCWASVAAFMLAVTPRQAFARLLPAAASSGTRRR